MTYLPIFPAERRRAGLAIPTYLFFKVTPPPWRVRKVNICNPVKGILKQIRVWESGEILRESGEKVGKKVGNSPQKVGK